MRKGHCDLTCKCGSGFFLSKNEIYEVEKPDVKHKFYNARLLRCMNCQAVTVPEITKVFCETVANAESAELAESEYHYDFDKIVNYQLTDKFITSKVGFLYDRDDYYFFPGLQREWNIGFLTPVYFNIEVLLKYSHHPQYSLELGADTYGYIYKGEQSFIPFGINNNGKVIMWLGDVQELDLNEQHYLRSENILSENNIFSQFYEAQIGNIWADPSRENRIFSQRKELHEKTLGSYNLSISQLEPETLKEAGSVIRPIVSTLEAFSKVIISMNKIFVESINKKGLGDFLKRKFNIKIDGLGGNKLFQLWLENCTDIQNAANVVSPLFVLYDLRVAMAHLQSEETKEEFLSKSCERLELGRDCRDYLVIYDRLLDHIGQMYTTIIKSNFIIIEVSEDEK
jgi:hypothetical protein